MTAVCFVDTETTGLHPDRHQIWEVALITPAGDEHVWQFAVENETDADPFALQVGHYWERRWDPFSLVISVDNAIYEAQTPESRRSDDTGRAIKPDAAWCRHFRNLTAGCHLAGAVVSFDEERLRRLLWSHGVLPRWHYHLVDVEALAAGHLHAPPPWNSNELSSDIGVNPKCYDRHTALGDARWAKAIYEKVMG